MLAILRFLIDAVVYLSVLTLVAIGLGLLVIVGRYFYDLLRGAQDPRSPVPADTDLPRVLLQIPVFNEPMVTEQALRCVAQIDWPKDKLRIQLLDDSTDETTERAAVVIDELRAAGALIDHVRRTDRSGFKAGACAHGLSITDEPFIAMLDADFRPPPEWLKRTVPLFLSDPRAGFVQSRCEFQNYRTNWLTRAQGLVQDGHYLVEQRSRALAGWLFQFNGTGGIWRRATVEDAGGWSDYSLTEDLDLTVRAELRDWHGLFVSEPPIPGQVPEEIRDFRRQQRRWSNGFVQVAQKTILPIWNSHWSMAKRLTAISLIAHQIFFPAAAIGIVAGVIGVFLHGSLDAYSGVVRLVAIMTALVVVGFTMPPYFTLGRGSLSDYLKTMASVPPLMIYLAFANGAKILQTIRGRKSTFKRTPKLDRENETAEAEAE